jgi:hypothetical protein
MVDLLRGVKLGLPSGQDVARCLEIPPLTSGQISQGPDGAVAKEHGLDRATPLWYYVLKEAQVTRSGRWLGPVGSRIVSEVLVGVILADPLSYLNLQPSWEPDRPIASERGSFSFTDLLRFTGWFGRVQETKASTLRS